MITIHILFIILSSFVSLNTAFLSICDKDVCFGTMDQLASITDRTRVYYVKPDGLVGADNDKITMKMLNRGKKVVCNDTTDSLMGGTYPWIIESNISLLPSCKEKQTLRRVSEPSERDDLQALTYAEIIAEEMFAPCTILLVTCYGRVELSDFNIDNTFCLSLLEKKQLPSFVSSALNVAIQPKCMEAKFSNLSGNYPYVIHVRQTLDIDLRNASISFNYIENGHVLLDMIENDMIEVQNVSRVSYNSPHNASNWICNDITDIKDHMGLANVADYKEREENNCHLFVHMILHVTFGMLCIILAFFSCWEVLESGKGEMLKKKKKKNKNE